MAGQPERTARSSRSWGSQGGFSKRNGISHSLSFISEGRTLRSVTEIFWYPHLYAAQGAPDTPRAGAARTSGSFGCWLGVAGPDRLCVLLLLLLVSFPAPAPFSVGIACSDFTTGLVSAAFVVVIVLW
jgi:hypothetical protein